jgi:hypothetical protein
MRTRNKYQKYNDAGHGWLRVSKEELSRLGIAGFISPYSYQKGKYAYLEEDLDASTFYYKKKDVFEQFDVKQHYAKGYSAIRNYDVYDAGKDQRKSSLNFWWTKEGGLALVFAGGYDATTGCSGMHLYKDKHTDEDGTGFKWRVYMGTVNWVARNYADIGERGVFYRNDLDRWNLEYRPASKNTIQFPPIEKLATEFALKREKEQLEQVLF